MSDALVPAPGVGVEVRLSSATLSAQQSMDGSLSLGEVPERPKGSDCKSDGNAFAGSNPALPTNHYLD